MKRAVSLLVYRAVGFRPSDHLQMADAIESAWSLSGAVPFEGSQPIKLSYAWESGVTIKPEQYGKLWNGMVKHLMKRKFLNPDGAPFEPGPMKILPHDRDRKVFICHLTFERE